MLIPLPNDKDKDGPRLSPCQYDVHDITFQKFLGPHRDSGELPHGRVFRVKIGSSVYALKVFRFFDIDEIRPYIGDDRLKRRLPDETVRNHIDPFFAECRAFGKLVEGGQDAVLAVRCHGYMLLGSEMEQQIEREFGFSDWNRGEEHQGEPLRAILKDFIRWKTPFHCKKFADLRKNLKTLNHKQLILNMDINEDNYVGGRLVDFSIAMTNPHILFQPGLRTKRRNRLDVGFDLACFDEMVEEYEARKEEDRSHNEWAVRLRRRTK